MTTKTIYFYMDESGTRHPDHKGHDAAHKRDWFALGGVLVDEDELDNVTSDIQAFRNRWPQLEDFPLHSHEIRSSNGNFKWLRNDAAERQRFMNELGDMLVGIPVVGIACVIDRPGYNARYKDKYEGNRWRLCKTAFAIAVERAAKFAISRDRKLRIFVERRPRRR